MTHSERCECTNPVCRHATTDEERAMMLRAFDAALDESVRYMPLRDDDRGPVIRGRCRLDSDEARSLLVTAEEAARQIREDGVRGFYIYAGRADHGTAELVITDEDEPDAWPDVRPTLTISSGSGEGRHRYWINDGWERGAEGKGDLQGAGGVRVRNTGVVVPGSIHHDSAGIYHVSGRRPMAPLAPDELPTELQPAGSGSRSGEHTYQSPTDADESAVDVVHGAIKQFRLHDETTPRAIDYLRDLQQGYNLREHGFIPNDEENEGGCRYQANLSLASTLYGVLLMAGEVDDDRNQWLISEYLAHLAQTYPWTDCGQPRKLRLSRAYIERTVEHGIETFDHRAFVKWQRKRDPDRQHWTGDYSPATNEAVTTIVSALTTNGPDGYPTAAEIVENCQAIDPSRSPETHRKALSRLVGTQVRQAHLGGNQYVYYPLDPDLPDPEAAVAITPERSEPWC